MENDSIYSFTNPYTGQPLIKHWNFYVRCIKSAQRESNKRFHFLGGGVNGGKTYCCLITLLTIADMYPQCKIHVVRKSMPNLIRTTVESLRKMVGSAGTWNRSMNDFYYELPNGSRICFFSENFNADKDLDRWKGFETNIIFLEQIEELQDLSFQKAMERVGRWKIGNLPMPAPMILSTFNPTPIKWVRELTYLPYVTNSVPSNTNINFITSKDNPFITSEELEFYNNMDTKHREQFVEGDWNVFENIKAFLYAFDMTKNVGTVEQDKESVCHISFDFNVNPITAILFNVDVLNRKLRVFKEFRIENSDIHVLLKNIIEDYPSTLGYEATGDASGKARNINIPNGLTTYDIISRKLRMPPARIKVPRRNLGHLDSRVVCNTVLEKYDVLIDSKCEYLIQDILSVEANESGKIDKRDLSKTHLIDCFRYAIHTYFASEVIREVWD